MARKVLGTSVGHQNFGINLTREEFWVPARATVSKQVANVQLHDGVEETIKTLHEKGVMMAVITSTGRKVLDNGIKDRSIYPFFETTVTGDEIEKLKPDPQQLYVAMERMGADPKQTLIVGDSPHDIGAGKNAGISTCLHFPVKNHLFYTREYLEEVNADYFIEEFSELLGIV